MKLIKKHLLHSAQYIHLGPWTEMRAKMSYIRPRSPQQVFLVLTHPNKRVISGWMFQWRIQVLKKEGARLHKVFKLTDFCLSLTLKKVKFVEKREGRASPPPHLNPPLCLAGKVMKPNVYELYLYDCICAGT